MKTIRIQKLNRHHFTYITARSAKKRRQYEPGDVVVRWVRRYEGTTVTEKPCEFQYVVILKKERQGYTVRDLGSVNNSWCNVPVRTDELYDFDTFTIPLHPDRDFFTDAELRGHIIEKFGAAEDKPSARNIYAAWRHNPNQPRPPRKVELPSDD